MGLLAIKVTISTSAKIAIVLESAISAKFTDWCTVQPQFMHEIVQLICNRYLRRQNVNILNSR